MKNTFLLAVLICALPAGSPFHAEDAAEQDAGGEVYKVDGDTIRVPSEVSGKSGLRTEVLGEKATPRVMAVSGRTALDPARTAHMKGQFTGRAVSVAVQAGDRVKAGDALAVIESVDLAGAKGNYLSAVKQMESDRAQLNADQAQIDADKAQETQDTDSLSRIETLANKKILPEKALYDARATVTKDKIATAKDVAAMAKDQGAMAKDEAALGAANQQLRVFGLTEEDVKGIADQTGDERRMYRVRSPREGVVLERSVTAGELADPTTNLFTISDTAELLLWIDVPEDAAANARAGQKVAVYTAADPKRKLESKVEWISPTLDADKHTLKVRARLANPDGKLLSDMSCRVEIEMEAGEPTLPASAVVTDQGGSFALVKQSEGKDAAVYKRVTVAAEPAGNGRVRVTSGLHAGDAVVVSQTLGLLTEIKQAAH